MNPGKLDRRVTIESRTLTKDAAGGRVETWTTLANVWAEIVTRKASESVVSDADRSVEEKQFRIRYRADIVSGTHRISYQAKSYDITGMIEEGRQHTMLIDCRATQALTHV